MGLIIMAIVVVIFIKFWLEKDIEIKWKIILTLIAIGSQFVFYGIGTYVVAITVIMMLRWNGSKIL